MDQEKYQSVGGGGIIATMWFEATQTGGSAIARGSSGGGRDSVNEYLHVSVSGSEMSKAHNWGHWADGGCTIHTDISDRDTAGTNNRSR